MRRHGPVYRFRSLSTDGSKSGTSVVLNVNFAVFIFRILYFCHFCAFAFYHLPLAGLLLTADITGAQPQIPNKST